MRELCYYRYQVPISYLMNRELGRQLRISHSVGPPTRTTSAAADRSPTIAEGRLELEDPTVSRIRDPKVACEIEHRFAREVQSISRTPRDTSSKCLLTYHERCVHARRERRLELNYPVVTIVRDPEVSGMI